MGWMNGSFRVQRDSADETAARNSSGLIGDNADEHLIFLKRCKTIIHLICVAESFLFKNSFVLPPPDDERWGQSNNFIFLLCFLLFCRAYLLNSYYLAIKKKREMWKMDTSMPVAILSGDEFLPKEGITFAQQVLDFFKKQGGVANTIWGSVLLDMKGIQSDKSHGIGRIKAASFAAIKDVLEQGEIILPLDYYATGGKKQMTGMIAAPIRIGTDSFFCVVVVIYNLKEHRLYLHETFLTEKIPEIAASSLVRGSHAASPQSRGNVAKILFRFLNTKQ